MKRPFAPMTGLVVAVLIGACAPEVGSDEWCEDMVEKPRGDWSANDARAFAEHCIFKEYGDEDED